MRRSGRSEVFQGIGEGREKGLEGLERGLRRKTVGEGRGEVFVDTCIGHSDEFLVRDLCEGRVQGLELGFELGSFGLNSGIVRVLGEFGREIGQLSRLRRVGFQGFQGGLGFEDGLEF
jgi:hypothetical protein